MTPDGTPTIDLGKPDDRNLASATPKTVLKRVLIIGATGVFGSRLAQHLARDRRYELLVASRSLKRSESLAEDLNGSAAKVTPVELDTTHRINGEIAALKPWCVADCSGPFQRMSYATARAALNAGSHIVDLADAAGYLSGYCDALNELARRKRRCAIAGASSTPALSGAVVAHLTRDMREVRDIDLAILPGGRGPVGPAVIDAILSYAGTPISAWRSGKPGPALGWGEPKSVSIQGLFPRRAVQVATFDAEFLGRRHRVRGDISFRAGLESGAEQRGLEALAMCRRARLLGEPRFLTPVLQQMRKITRMTTTDRGGMQVQVRGRLINGRAVTRVWDLLAENGDGPSVPILPVAAAINALEAYQIGPGAKLAPEALTMDEILRQAQPYAIRWQERTLAA